MITISAGHYGPGTGANGLLDEGLENIKVTKRVVEILRTNDIQANQIIDTTSKSAKNNVNWLIAQHNKTSRKIDVQIHFNSSAGTHSKGIGVETLIHNGKNIDLATKLTDAIANVSGLKNRGVKIRTDLGFLKRTNKPAYLIEVCFVNDSVDVALYKRDFEKICHAIANELAKAVGKSLKPSTTTTVEDKKESEDIMHFTNSATKNAVRDKLQQAVDKKIIDKGWLTKFDESEMTYGDYLGLEIIINQRSSN